MLTEYGIRAKEASHGLATANTTQKNEALECIARALVESAPRILTANAADVQRGRAAGLTNAMIDRLTLTEARIAGIADAVRHVATLPDPVGRVLSETVRPNGLRLVKVAVPIGVLAVIFEARPNVTADAAALALKSGNAVILRGGREAIESNIAIAEVMRSAVATAGLPEDVIQLVTDTSRASADALMRLNGYVDVLIPRGGAGLIRAAVERATVPVIETGAGVCHTYVDAAADIEQATRIIVNAKTSRPSVCNACECMLIHEQIAARALPRIGEALREKGVEVRGDAATCAQLPYAVAAADDDWGREYNDMIIACRVVTDVAEAVRHIRTYGTGHSECIVTEEASIAEWFLNEVDAAAVYWNASTRFTDGGEFGMGAEIGIATQKLHARGPLGLNELTTMKYRIYGQGQIRT